MLRRQRLPGVRLAVRIRDAVSTRFGVKPIGALSVQRAAPPRVGDKLDFFTVERIEPEILTLSDRDRHLDVLSCVTIHDHRLEITSSVKVHNLYGRIYMIPVAPGHRLIVNAMLRKLSHALGSQAQDK